MLADRSRTLVGFEGFAPVLAASTGISGSGAESTTNDDINTTDVSLLRKKKGHQ